MVQCALNSEDTCVGWTAGAGALITQSQPALAYGYGAVARTVPNAHVVVTGYPRLFSPEFGDFTRWPGRPREPPGTHRTC